MKINKQVRDDLAIRLTAKALAKHGPELSREATRINQGLEKAHLAYLAWLMPEVSPERYSHLIQQGALVGTISGAELLYYHHLGEGGKAETKNKYPGQTSIGTHPEQLTKGLKGALKSEHWSVAMETIDIIWNQYGTRFEFEPRLSKTLPDFRGRAYVHLNLLKAPDDSVTPGLRKYLEEVEPLFEAAEKLCAKAGDLFREGLAYHEEVEALLAACGTRKKLEELFPEAAALLPPLPPKRTDLVPTELAANVRRRLKEGVPE